MAGKYEAEIDLGERNTSQTLAVEFIGKNKDVLDVGTATGYVPKVLVRRGCRVTGIELNTEAARQAEEHCERIIVGDVESLDLDEALGEERFDVILFGDVLEHLKDPLEVLRRFKKFLKPEGYAVASVPNIAHGSVRLALMQGNFQYRPLGLLDSTHLRFFTRESMEQLFNEAGFMVGEVERVRLGIFSTEVEVDRESVTKETLKALQSDPESRTYQFVLTAHPYGQAGEFARLSNRARLLGEELTRRDELIYTLNRKLRNLEELQRQLDRRNEQFAEKKKEATELARELAGRNRQLVNNEKQTHQLQNRLERLRNDGK